MRILVAHSEYRHRGGEEQAIDNDLAALSVAGHDTRRLTVASDDLDDHPLGALVATARTVWSPSGFRAVRAAIDDFQPDVLHVHNTFPNLGHAPWVAAHRAGVPVVQTLHNFRWVCAAAVLERDGSPCTDCLDEGSTRPAIRHRCYRDSRMASAVVVAYGARARRHALDERLVDRILVPSQFMRDTLVGQGFPEDRTRVRPNLSPALPAGTPMALPALPTEFVLYLGRLSSEKGIEVLVDAWTGPDAAGLPPLVIAGDGEPGLVNALEARGASTRGRVRFIGRVERGAVGALLDRATLLVMPSTCHENQPLAMVEAYSRGLPAVASSVGGLPELVQPVGDGLVFEPGSAGAIRTRVAEVLGRGPDELERLRASARRLWEGRFRPASGVGELVEHYVAVSESSAAAGG